MKKKIVIIGALGYLGTELSKLYSGESWCNKIVAIDNRFFSERVNQLRSWNIEFFQGQILDKSFLKIHSLQTLLKRQTGDSDAARLAMNTNYMNRTLF